MCGHGQVGRPRSAETITEQLPGAAAPQWNVIWALWHPVLVDSDGHFSESSDPVMAAMAAENII